MNNRLLNISMAVAIVFGFMATAEVSAQEHRRVEVTSVYNPEVDCARKLLPPTEIATDPNEETTDVRSEIKPTVWQIALQDTCFNAAITNYTDFNRCHPLYARVGVGYPLGSEAIVRYTTQNVQVGYFGVGVDHRGDFAPRHSTEGEVRSIANSYDMQNHVQLGGGLICGNKLFEAVLDYDFDIYNRYAELKSLPARLYFHDADLSLSFGDNFIDLSHLNFGVEAHGGFWSHTPPPAADVYIPASEYNAGGSLKFARSFAGNVIGVSASYDMWQMLHNSYGDVRIGGEISYARNFHFVNVDAGFGYIYDKVRDRTKPSHFITPRVNMQFNFDIDELMPYIDLNTTLSQNGFSSLYGINPFMDYDLMQEAILTMPSTRSYNLSVGFTGITLTSKLNYRLYVGANFMRDQLLWWVDPVGNFGVAQCSNNRIFVGADVEFRPMGGLLVAASVYAHTDNKVSPYVVNDPRVEASIEAQYTLKRWRFGINGQYVGARKWSGMIDEQGSAPVAFVAPGYFDLSLSVNFKVNRFVEAYIDGYNLLNQRIFEYANYYRNGIGFMAGVKINF